MDEESSSRRNRRRRGRARSKSALILPETSPSQHVLRTTQHVNTIPRQGIPQTTNTARPISALPKSSLPSAIALQQKIEQLLHSASAKPSSRNTSDPDKMLGAQARAAEYKAARNASARQADREAEEQTLPPKPTPISLSAFTKNVQGNRNKGTKAWIPLILEDTGEEEESKVDAQADSASPDTEATETETKPAYGKEPSQRSSQIFVNLPKPAVPTARRAMVELREISPNLVNPTPQRRQHHAIIAEVPHNVPSASYGTPNLQEPDEFQYPGPDWTCNLPVYPPTDLAQESTPEGMRRIGGLMVPTDITPTKQEEKLSMISHGFPNPFAGYSQMQQPNFESPMFIGTDYAQQSYLNDIHELVIPGQDQAQQYPVPEPFYQVARRPPLQHYQREEDSSSASTGLFSPHALAPTIRHQPLADSRPVQQFSGFPAETYSPIQMDQQESPYDRTTEWRTFVAAQINMAKTRKTVLHNPELNKERALVLANMASHQSPSISPTKSPKELNNHNQADRQAIARAMRNPPPGLLPIGEPVKPPAIEEPPSLSAADVALRQKFCVDSSAWLELKPPTRDDRKKMNSTVKKIKMQIGEKLDSFASEVDCQEFDVVRWLCTDPRGHQAARGKVNQIAVDYSGRQRGKGDEKPGEIDFHGGKVRAAGNMLANLTEYIMQERSPNIPQDYFSMSKAAPDFAIERGGLLGSGFGTNSYFEDDSNGFRNAPTRIARDPRFRPQGKDGVKFNPKEELKDRYEMYGRRRL